MGGVGAGGADAARAATFEEFMAEKRREEAVSGPNARIIASGCT